MLLGRLRELDRERHAFFVPRVSNRFATPPESQMRIIEPVTIVANQPAANNRARADRMSGNLRAPEPTSDDGFVLNVRVLLVFAVRELKRCTGAVAIDCTAVPKGSSPRMRLQSLVSVLLAAAGDTNPKRQRGLQFIPSLTLRVSVGCLIPDRAKYMCNLWGTKDRHWGNRRIGTGGDTEVRIVQAQIVFAMLWS